MSLPKTVFPGGALVGCDAGYLNVEPHQGQPCGHQDRHARRTRPRTSAITHGRQHDELTAYPEAFEKSWLHEELNKARNFKAWFKKGLWVATFMNGIEQFALGGQHSLDPAPRQAGPRVPEAGGGVQAHRLSQAGRQAHVRPPVVGVHLQHQPRGGPAGAPDAEGRVGAGASQPGEIRGPGSALLPGRRVRVRQGTKTTPSGCRSTRRTACTARPATSRTRRRTSCGSRPRAAAGRTTRTCSSRAQLSSRGLQ